MYIFSLHHKTFFSHRLQFAIACILWGIFSAQVWLGSDEWDELVFGGSEIIARAHFNQLGGALHLSLQDAHRSLTCFDICPPWPAWSLFSDVWKWGLAWHRVPQAAKVSLLAKTYLGSLLLDHWPQAPTCPRPNCAKATNFVQNFFTHKHSCFPS